MKKYILEDVAIIILLILLATGFFFAVFNIIADRIEEPEKAQEEEEQVRTGHMLRHHIRVSGIYGINLNENPEL